MIVVVLVVSLHSLHLFVQYCCFVQVRTISSMVEMHILLIVLLASAALALPQAPAPCNLLESRGEFQDRETPCVALDDLPRFRI